MVDRDYQSSISSHGDNGERQLHNKLSSRKKFQRTISSSSQQSCKTKHSDIKCSPSVIRNVPSLKNLQVSALPVIANSCTNMSAESNMPQIQTSNHRLKGNVKDTTLKLR